MIVCHQCRHREADADFIGECACSRGDWPWIVHLCPACGAETRVEILSSRLQLHAASGNGSPGWIDVSETLLSNDRAEITMNGRTWVLVLPDDEEDS